ncbi:hypothetical protein K443DRAFT_681333, partial [Laccaria amethystina LaAM-08-1]
MATSQPPVEPIVESGTPVKRNTSRRSSTDSFKRGGNTADNDLEVQVSSKDEGQLEICVALAWHEETPVTFRQRYRPFILSSLVTLILGWWISATVLKATRHRWIVQTLFAWAFILIIAFRYTPNSVVAQPISAIWDPLVQRPWYKLPYRARLVVGWLCLLAIVFGSVFGFRGQLLETGLLLQQVVALFVLKTDTGFSIFKWIATLASDFLNQAEAGATFFFDEDSISKHWFFVNILASIIFFIAFVQAMYYLDVIAWFFFKIMDVSGAEAVVAAASPWIGQGESACLVRPYVDLMTESELHLTTTSGFSTIAGSGLAAYISLGVPAENLVTSSLRLPETEEPVTRGHVTVDGGESKAKRPANVLHAFSQGAVFGLIVAGQILTNVLTVLSLVGAINGLLTWVGRGFGIHNLTLQLVIGYVFYPVTFFLGVPQAEILTVSQLFATKLIANEFAAYLQLQSLMKTAPLSFRAYTICSYGLCGFANLGSLGIHIGVLSALAPSRSKVIARIAFSAMVWGFLSTLQTAGIV